MLKINLQKKLQRFTLELDLEIKPAFTALFGPSGAGKTTSLNLLAGLTKPDSGKLSLKQKQFYSEKQKINIKPQQRNLGYIFQESRLFQHMTVKQNIEFGFQLLTPNSRKFSFDEIIETTGIVSLLERSPAALSGGEKQRVALARALLASPDYLLMDEPLASLDQPTRLSFLIFLKSIHQKFNLPILYVTHDIASVINFADEVLILKEGKIVGYDKPMRLLAQLQTRPLAAGEDITNIFKLEIIRQSKSRGITVVKSDKLEFVLPHLDLETGGELLLNIPASEIILGVTEPNGLSASNILPGIIENIYHLQERVLVEVNAGEKFTVEIVEATVERLNLKKGTPVYLIIKASSFRRLS